MLEWAVQPRLNSDQLAAVHVPRSNDRAIAAFSEQARLSHLVLADQQRGRGQAEHVGAAARWGSGWTPLALAHHSLRRARELAKSGETCTAAVKNVNIPGMRDVSPVEMAQNVPLPRKSWPISAEKRCSSDLDASSLSAWSLTSVCGGSERLALRTHPVLR
jgi:hypothetical protein